MDILIGCRQTELLERAAKEGLTIVCATLNHIDQIIKRAAELHLTIPVPLTYAKFLSIQTNDDQKFLIDDLDQFIRVASKTSNVVGAAVNSDSPSITTTFLKSKIVAYDSPYPL